VGLVSGNGEIHQHSGWLVPLGLFGVVVALSGFFLLYYLRPPPAPFRDARPTAAATMIALNIHGLDLHIPARFIEARESRTGGSRDAVSLLAALPDMRGYTVAEDSLFAGNAPDSPIVHILLRADANGMDTQTRLARIYMPYIAEPKGEPAPFGLTRYEFRADSGYGRSELYVSKGDGPLLLCEQPAQDLPSPNCLAIERPIAEGVNLAYRFKRAHLARWQAVAAGVHRLISEFRK
jgi:hypothetical protein